MNEKSILKEIKKLLGIDREYTEFDTDIRIYINSALARLNQLGEYVSSNLVITGYDETWESLFGEDPKLNQIQLYVFLKTKLVFDPPASSTAVQSMENQVKELEWEINVLTDKT